MIRNSILMTVFNRETEVLLATLRSLWRSDLTETELVLVDDGSTVDQEWLPGYLREHFDHATLHRMEPYEAFRAWVEPGAEAAKPVGPMGVKPPSVTRAESTIEAGYNGPSKAFNKALELARGDRLFIMSSDVLVNPALLEHARRFDSAEMVWTPLVVDTETSAQYCGPRRLFPMPWFLSCSRSIALEIGGWDEKYLEGFCYDDNDFVGRLVLRTGRFVGDWTAIAYHQSHDQPAYDVAHPAILAANERNRLWTMKKWTGIPFSAEFIPFDVIRKPWSTGDVVHECRYEGTLLEDTIRWTVSPFAKEKAHARSDA